MQTLVARTLLLLAALALAVPESDAKRIGSSRPTGGQSQIITTAQPTAPRAQPAPPPAAPAPVQRPQPDAAQQQMPPLAAPAQSLPQQASSPWGGMLGGALIGLGLGSLISGEPDPNAAAQSEGGSGTAGDSAAGTGETKDNAALPVEQAQENGLESALLLGVLAVVVFFLVRRIRRRAHRH